MTRPMFLHRSFWFHESFCVFEPFLSANLLLLSFFDKKRKLPVNKQFPFLSKDHSYVNFAYHRKEDISYVRRYHKRL